MVEGFRVRWVGRCGVFLFFVWFLLAELAVLSLVFGFVLVFSVGECSRIGFFAASLFRNLVTLYCWMRLKCLLKRLLWVCVWLFLCVLFLFSCCCGVFSCVTTSTWVWVGCWFFGLDCVLVWGLAVQVVTSCRVLFLFCVSL